MSKAYTVVYRSISDPSKLAVIIEYPDLVASYEVLAVRKEAMIAIASHRIGCRSAAKVHWCTQPEAFVAFGQ
jgi:hypothetical protein